MSIIRGTNFHDLSWRSQVRRLRRIAAHVLPLYGLEDASFRLLKYHDNGVFRVLAPGGKVFVLRISRVEKVSPGEVQSEMLWLEALRKDLGLRVPQPVPARDGSLVTTVDDANCCLLTWVPGTMLRKRLTPENIAAAGETTALLHRHARHWRRPAGFERPL